MDEIIEEAALIWLNERDDVPCSIRRARLGQMCSELAAEQWSQKRREALDSAPDHHAKKEAA